MYRILKMVEHIDVNFLIRPIDILDVSKHSHILSFFRLQSSFFRKLGYFLLNDCNIGFWNRVPVVDTFEFICIDIRINQWHSIGYAWTIAKHLGTIAIVITRRTTVSSYNNINQPIGYHWIPSRNCKLLLTWSTNLFTFTTNTSTLIKAIWNFVLNFKWIICEYNAD